MSCIMHKDVALSWILTCAMLLSCTLNNAQFSVDDIDSLYVPQDARIACPIVEPEASCSIPPENIIFLLTNPDAPGSILLQNLLQNDLYCSTYPLNFRNPLTIPSLSPLFQAKPYCNYALSIKPFVNLMDKVNFTPQSTKILSYIALGSDFLNILAADLSAIFPTLNTLPEVMSLLGNITEQQREAGFMFFAQGNNRCVTWSVALPIFYFQHNFFLTDKEQDTLNKATFFTGVGTKVASRDLNTFIQDHLVNDVISLGDLRFDVWYNSPHEALFRVAVGAQITIPTAHVFISGLSGACPCTFNRQEPMPFFDIQLLMNLALCQGIADKIELTELVADYSIGALDRLGSILLNNSAGDQHVNFGPTLHVSYDFSDNFSFDFIGEAAYYAPHRETRLFKTNKAVVNFNRDYDETADALQNIQFLSQQATDTLYPMSVEINVKPGMMGHFAASFTGRKSVFTATVGYDFWCRSGDEFGAICQRYTPPNPNYTLGAALDLTSGMRPATYQGKIFAVLAGEIFQEQCGTSCSTSRVGIRGDYTINRLAIGRDFTISLDFIMDF